MKAFEYLYNQCRGSHRVWRFEGVPLPEKLLKNKQMLFGEIYPASFKTSAITNSRQIRKTNQLIKTPSKYDRNVLAFNLLNKLWF